MLFRIACRLNHSHRLVQCDIQLLEQIICCSGDCCARVHDEFVSATTNNVQLVVFPNMMSHFRMREGDFVFGLPTKCFKHADKDMDIEHCMSVCSKLFEFWFV